MVEKRKPPNLIERELELTEPRKPATLLPRKVDVFTLKGKPPTPPTAKQLEMRKWQRLIRKNLGS